MVVADCDEDVDSKHVVDDEDDEPRSRDDVIADDDERMMFLGEKEDRDRHTDAK